MPNNFIKIVDEGTPFPWHYVDENGNAFDTIFTIRTLPKAKRQEFDKQFSKRKWTRGVERVKVDRDGFADACLDYSIVDWDRLVMITMNPDGTQKEVEVPCETRYKRLLPELLKASLTMVTVGRDVSEAFGGETVGLGEVGLRGRVEHEGGDEDDETEAGEGERPTQRLGLPDPPSVST